MSTVMSLPDSNRRTLWSTAIRATCESLADSTFTVNCSAGFTSDLLKATSVWNIRQTYNINLVTFLKTLIGNFCTCMLFRVLTSLGIQNLRLFKTLPYLGYSYSVFVFEYRWIQVLKYSHLLGMHIGLRCIDKTGFFPWFDNRIERKAYRLNR